jgi:coenzyme PQQ biosynthesis protein PqqD
MSDLDLHSRPALAKHVRLQIDPVTRQPVLLYPEGILELNPTAAVIVRHCDGQTNLATIITTLAAEYEATEEELCEDVFDCVSQLRARNFMVLAP